MHVVAVEAPGDAAVAFDRQRAGIENAAACWPAPRRQSRSVMVIGGMPLAAIFTWCLKRDSALEITSADAENLSEQRADCRQTGDQQGQARTNRSGR